MERNNDKISSFQLGMILAVTIIGIGFLTLPRNLAEEVGPDGWVVLLLGSVIAFIVGRLMVVLMQKFPQETIIEVNSSLMGKPLGTIISIGFFIHCIIFAAIEVRVSGEITKEYLLLNTPIEVLMIALLIGAVYLVRSGIEPIGRMAQIILPVVTIIAIVVILPVLPELDLTNLLPVLKTPIHKIIGAISTVFFSFMGIELILLFSSFVIKPKNMKKYTSLAVVMVAAIYMFILVVVVTRFGLIETTHIIWPVLELFKTVDLPGAFIENIEAFIIAIWMLSVFMTLATLYFGASLVLSRILKSKEHNYFVLPILPMIYYLALIPDNIAQVSDYMNMYSNCFGIFYIILLPLLLLSISIFKKNKGGKRHA
ncbi:MAG: spore germination protein [Marinisporobacter sp.]|nr:spore germination protein [Marinisporobacter sp.]